MIFFFLVLLVKFSVGREWDVEELKNLKIPGLKRLIKMRNEECDGCETKNDFIQKMLEIQHIEPEVTFSNPNSADELFEDKEKDLGLIMSDPIFLKYEDRKRRFMLLSRLKAMNFDTSSMTQIPASNKGIKKRREEYMQEKELEGDKNLIYMQAYLDGDIFDEDEL